MAWKNKSSATFSGGSGQMAVIGELLHRKCNAAVPHVDVGTDVFAFRDDREDVARVQVKTSPGVRYRNGGGYHAKFGIPMVQLSRADALPLFYALAVRLGHRWGSFIVIGRAKLEALWDDGLGSENRRSGDLELYIQFRAVEEEDRAGRMATEGEPKLRARCGRFDLSDYIDAWETLPPLRSRIGTDIDEFGTGTVD